MRKKRKQHKILSRLEHFQLFALDQDTSNPTIKMRISCLPILGGFTGWKKNSGKRHFLVAKPVNPKPTWVFFLQRKKTRLKWFRNSASLRVHVCWPFRGEKKSVQSASALPRVFSACASCAAMSVISLDVLPSDFSLPPSIHRNPSLKRCHILVKARPMAAENSKVTESKKKRRNGPGLRRKEPKQLEPPTTCPYVFSTNHPCGKWAHLTFEATNPKGEKKSQKPRHLEGERLAFNESIQNLQTLSRNDLQVPFGSMSQDKALQAHWNSLGKVRTWLRSCSSHLSHLGLVHF